MDLMEELLNLISHRELDFLSEKSKPKPNKKANI
jgi:hypothetical protein